MPKTQVLLIVLALLLALAMAGFQYYHKSKNTPLQRVLFGILRFLSFFALFLLLINPKIRKIDYYSEKPLLLLAIDNSASVAHFGKTQQVKNFAAQFTEDPQLAKRFKVETFTFGTKISNESIFSFDEAQTNVSGALKELNKLYEHAVAPIILITDGNQTLGEDYVFLAQNLKNQVFPVVVGDTTRYSDLTITRINANKYAFLENEFPVEIMVNYSGTTTVQTKFEIRKGNSLLFSRDLTFDDQNNSAVIQTNLPASSVGTHLYSAKILPLSEEKNLSNNDRQFAVEIIDERTKVLVLYELSHPDLGALKRSIESNKQREAVVRQIEESYNLEDYQVVILYQPGSKFRSLFNDLTEEKKHYWVIAGPETDWVLMNEQQDRYQQAITGQQEEISPVYNDAFSPFQFDDLDFEGFPPLEGNFGELVSREGHQILLFRKVQGIETTDPLLSVSEENGLKSAFLFGTGIWKWRSHVYQETDSFESFDKLTGQLIQYLSSARKKTRLDISYEPIYREGEELIIQADYFDENYVFDPDASLVLTLTREDSGQSRQLPFVLTGSNYRVDLSDIEPGEYDFSVSVKNENLSKTGKFRLISFEVEQQFISSNYEGLQLLASQKGHNVYFLDDFKLLKAELLSSKLFLPVQKSRENNVPLVEWYYLLGIIILSLSLEWFLRKYYGYI